MSIGNRISNLRKQNRYSQEYLAAQLGISRQAVSKWENDLTAPDTENLILLANLFGVSVEYLATGTEPEHHSAETFTNPRFRLKKRHCILLLSACISLILLFGIIYCSRLPVSWDAGTCGGGYATHIFHKYCDTLTERYWNGSDQKNAILSVVAVDGTQEAEWENRTIYLSFDIQYEHRTAGIVVERVHFIGHRYWFDTFRWGGAIIAE